MIRKGLLSLFLFALTNLFGQNTIGLPEIINYTKQSYLAGTQNWDVQQDAQGILYFANNDGLLTFDGNYWKVYPLPNKTIVRSVKFYKDKIYVGGQDELGYFSANKNDKLIYTSLKNLIPQKERSFTDVWDIEVYKEGVFFRTATKIFCLRNNAITVYKAPAEWRFMGMSNNVLVAQDAANGILFFDNGNWKPYFPVDQLPDEFLATGFVPLKNGQHLLTTLKHGVFIIRDKKVIPIKSKALDQIAASRIYVAAKVNNDWIALATSSAGCFIINAEGTLIQSFSRNEGLQNNNILSLFFDKQQNLWLGLDNGVDFIAFNNAIKQILPERHDPGAGYASALYNGQLYLGTSNGLFKADIETGNEDLSFAKTSFEPVAHSQGQVWNLSEVNGRLLMGHHEGAFLVEKNTATLLDNKSGFWTFLPFTNVLPSPLMIAGEYHGLSFYQYQNGNFIKAAKKADFESARFVTMDNDQSIWVAHPYKGIYRIKLNEDGSPQVKIYTDRNGLTSINNNYVFKIKNRIVITSETGIYEYDQHKDGFYESGFFKNIFKGNGIRYMKEDEEGNVWFIQNKQLGMVDFSGSRPSVIYFPELTNKMLTGFEHINTFGKNNIIVGAERGFYHINLDQYKNKKNPLHVLIRSVEALGRNDSLLFEGYNQRQSEIPSIANAYNSFRFQYTSTLYGQQANLQYSYFLKGFDRDWSEWTKKTEKEYTNLPAGKYSFMVKVRNNLGSESGVAEYVFTVLPPWYQSWWAYIGYALIVSLVFYWLYKKQKQKLLHQQAKHQEEQKKLQYLHHLELEKNEKEIIKLKNDKLTSEIEHKNTELASSTMHLLQKAEFLSKLKSELSKLMKASDDKSVHDEVKKMLKMLNEEERTDKAWEHFAQHFDHVHSNFIIQLKERFPNLTPNELKLCAYLRMNLSSKEIAQLMNISVRGIEISRYRLRKKLELPTEVNLFDYLMNIHAEKSA